MSLRCNAKWDKDNNCFVCTCPNCRETVLMTGLSEEEEEILRDGDVVEYWCDECDETLIVRGPEPEEEL